jgi:hypothetical protein
LKIFIITVFIFKKKNLSGIFLRETYFESKHKMNILIMIGCQSGNEEVSTLFHNLQVSFSNCEIAFGVAWRRVLERNF